MTNKRALCNLTRNLLRNKPILINKCTNKPNLNLLNTQMANKPFPRDDSCANKQTYPNPIYKSVYTPNLTSNLTNEPTNLT